MSELVSVLVPAYNAQRSLAQTLRSALAQTWPRLEIIVVDDGSTDSTLEIARRTGSARVCVLTQDNAGAAAARNAALKSAQGSYIQFLDADDLLAPDKISTQLKGAGAGERSRLLLTGRWGRFHRDPAGARFDRSCLWQDLAPTEWLHRKLQHNASMMPCSWLVSRRLAETVGPWNEALSLDDDGEYQCRLAAASDEVRFVGGATAYYRVGNVRSLSWQTSRKALASQWRSMQLCMGHLLALEDSDRTRQACMTYLQDNLTLFYPDAHDIVAQMRERAAALGGELQPPAQGRLFSLARRAIGWSNAKALRMLLGRQSTRLRSLVQP